MNLRLQDSTFLIICALYRSPDNNGKASCMCYEINNVTLVLCHSNPSATIWFGGDLNLPDIRRLELKQYQISPILISLFDP